MAGSGKDSIQPIKQEVPKFLRQFKEKAGQSESPNINSKGKVPERDENEEIRDDEAPLVHIPDNLTDSETELFLKDKYGNSVRTEDSKNEDDNDKQNEGNSGPGNDAEDGKIMFKKPTKRKEIDNAKTKDKDVKKKKKSKMDKVKNTKLLSFGDDEDE